MSNPKLTYTADLGWCLARGTLSNDGVPGISIVSPMVSDGGVHTPASSVYVHDRKGVKALGAICRALVPEMPLHGITLSDDGSLDPDDTKKLFLSFRAPDGNNVTLPLPVGPVKDVILAWWKAQAEPPK